MKGKRPDPGIRFGLSDILFPFLLPVKGVAWISQKLMEQAERELMDKSRVQKELLDLQMRFEMEEISEDEFQTRETELLEELEAIRKYEEEKRTKG